MKYTNTPREISIREVLDKLVLSPSMYEKLVCQNPNTRPIKELVNPPVKGSEVGQSSYVTASEYSFVRTRSLQRFSFLMQHDRQSIVPIKPQVFQNHKLAKNDILYSKDSNVGECCIIESNLYKKYMLSAGILKLTTRKNPLYLFAFLKHQFVKSQIRSMTAKGSTMSHSRLNVLSCTIPFPRGSNKDRVIELVEKMASEIIAIETLIRRKNKKIYRYIWDELQKNQSKSKFVYSEPTIKEVYSQKRLDAGIYSAKFKKKKFLIQNYANGYAPLTDSSLNFDVKPGPSLELKILKTRKDSDRQKNGFYTLLIPKDISEFGTVERLRYMGTAKQITELKFGDVIMGESGTWRSLVLLSDFKKCITNAHGNRLRQNDGDIGLSIYVRCILSWYKKFQLFDFMAVGGSGGHISPSYFNQILIPKFPNDVMKKIVGHYYSQSTNSGIWQLNHKRLLQLAELEEVLDHIIRDVEVDLDKCDSVKLMAAAPGLGGR